MSNPAGKSRPAGRHPIPHKPEITSTAERKGGKKLFAFIAVAILAGIPFAFGKYFEINFPDPYDSAANVYSAKHILDGAKLGVDEIPSCAMGTLVVNIIGVRIFGFNEAGPKVIQGIMQAAAFILMFAAMRKLFGTLAAAVGVIIASIYLSAPLIAKFGNVKEQYMIACMVMGMSCFVLSQLNGKWWQTLLAGGFFAWGPLFKETGYSAIAAVGLFVIVQPIFKHRGFKQTAIDIGLLVAGAAISILPLYVWIFASGAKAELPYSFVFKPAISVFTSSAKSVPEPNKQENAAEDKQVQQGLLLKLMPPYVRQSWEILNSQQVTDFLVRTMRYYLLLILPILLAATAIGARIIRLIMQLAGKLPAERRKNYERFVLLFSVWWVLDMAAGWVSPRQYEQYYLPLNGSAAMLGGYLIALYSDKYARSIYKERWGLVGAVGFICMVMMSWHIFFGIEKSPYSGQIYDQKSRGYVQRYNDIVSGRTKNLDWQQAGEYIRVKSNPRDKIYVWGWIPGIYISAQRFCPGPRAFTSEMQVYSPKELSDMVAELLSYFGKEMPKFIVDTHNRHFPYDGRPPLELWPIWQPQILKMEKIQSADSDKAYAEWLAKSAWANEAGRYEAMKPFRDFVMQNYGIDQVFSGSMFVVFKLKQAPAK
jgi:hypothetical protein